MNRWMIAFATVLSCCSSPPYPTFAGLTFEPSAAAYDPATERLLVLNDVDSIVYRYAIRDDRLVLPEGEFHRALRYPDEGLGMKFESLTRMPDGSFLAATAFDRPDPNFRRVVRFSFRRAGPIEAAPIPVDEEALRARVRAVTSGAWFKIEGVAVDAAGTSVLFGVRQAGPDYRNPRPLVLLLRCPFSEGRIGAPEAAFLLSTRETLGREEGLSDLQRDPRDGSWLILTSHEAGGRHEGHLFRLPAGAFEGPGPAPSLGRPLRAFRAKPEGLAILPTGALVVVFDDDKEPKKRFSGYEQSEGLFEIFEPGR
ncbi:MAG: hypothetical protein HYY17_12350 [Planctomycetes bacterium]|nr:hypothetical protein [Planctomycetota bacterium]